MSNLHTLIIIISSISLFVVGIPLLYGILLPIIKPTISNNSYKYLYAFSSGFFLMVATVLFIGESKTHLEEFFIETTKNNAVATKFIVGSIVAGIVFFGLLISLGAKYFFVKTRKSKNLNDVFVDNHNHDEMIFNINDYNPKSKTMAIFFLLSHRIPDGIIIGLLCSQIAREGVDPVSIIFLCSFIMHIIPEELIIYYRQIEMGISRKKATLNSLLAVICIIPLIIIGAVISWFSLENELAIHIIQLIAASFLLFISIIEFLPEFLHDIKISGKEWYITMLIFIIGIAIGLFVISLHDHNFHNDEHVHEQAKILFKLNKNIY